MKSFIYLLFTLAPALGLPQAHIGHNLEDLKSEYPEKVFEIDFARDGTKYAYTEMQLGIFIYYFDDSNISTHCMQIPTDMESLNAQVEIYNRKYVILNNNAWKAYLEGGNIMKIDLRYDTNLEKYYFLYYDE